MEKQYRQSYLNLTRNHALPTNCLPFSSRKNHSESLTKLLQMNQTIMDIVDPSFNTIIAKKRRSQAHFINIQNNKEIKKQKPKRIHQNTALMAPLKTSQRKKYLSLDESSTNQVQNIKHKQKKRKDIYDSQIQKFMTSKYDKQQIIQQYLKDRDSFVKMACEQIQHQIRHQARYLKRSTDKLKDKSSKKLPKIDQFTYIKMKKNKEKIKNGDYIKSITHLKKAETLDIKNRKRQQRIFRHKINSMQGRIDKIRDAPY